MKVWTVTTELRANMHPFVYLYFVYLNCRWWVEGTGGSQSGWVISGLECEEYGRKDLFVCYEGGVILQEGGIERVMCHALCVVRRASYPWLVGWSLSESGFDAYHWVVRLR